MSAATGESAFPAWPRPPAGESREARWGWWLALLSATSWVPMLLIHSWLKVFIPSFLTWVAAIAFTLAIIARRRVRQGLARPPRRGQIALTLVVSTVQLVLGLFGSLFLAFVAAWWLLFVKGVAV